MLGNVIEWCQDTWHDDYKGAPADGSAWGGKSPSHVLRGAAFAANGRICRAAGRVRSDEFPWDEGMMMVGLRVIVSPGTVERAAVKDFGIVDLRVEPGEAVVTLDGEPVPLVGGRGWLRVKPGQHVLRASRDHHEDASETVVVHDGATAAVQLVLKEISKGSRIVGRVGETRTNSIGMSFSWCPPGEFDMGSPANEPGRADNEGPVHRVTIPQGFWLGTYEVTQGEWQVVMASAPLKSPDSGRSGSGGDENRPVVNGYVHMCQEFVKKLAALDGNSYRLPSEAEWEYACRAGTTGARYGELDAVAWYHKNSGSRTHAVGSKRPNSWGLYDMLGNVREWCLDSWHESYDDAPTNGIPWYGGANVDVTRGGFFGSTAQDCRSGSRGFEGGGGAGCGFRVVALPGPAGHFPVVEQGLIDLRVEPGDVVVSLDGERKLVSGGRVQLRVRPGRYVLAASRENYEDASETVTVSGGVTASVLLVLKEKPKGPPVPASGRLGETWTNSIGMKFSWCPPGEFDMGSPPDEPGWYDHEGPVHRVRIPHGFWMGTHEVTQGQWQAVMGSNPAHFKGDDRRPVEMVSWNDCQGFVEKLAARDGNGYRLPSEAEWEYACRAGTTGARYGDLDGVAWYDKNSGGKTQSVGEKRPNAWGLYDMLGNVREWCQDTVHFGYSGAPTDGSAWDGGSGRRVLRGGSWYYVASYARAASRDGLAPDAGYSSSGVRVIVLPRTGADTPGTGSSSLPTPSPGGDAISPPDERKAEGSGQGEARFGVPLASIDARSSGVLSYSPDGKRVYLVYPEGNFTYEDRIRVIDVDRRSIVDEWNPGNDPACVTVMPGGTEAYVSVHMEGTVKRTELSTKRVLSTLSCPVYTQYSVLSRDGASLFCTARYDRLYRIDVGTNSITGKLTVAREPRELVLHPSGRLLYLGCSPGPAQAVDIIDLATFASLGTIPLPGNVRPTDMAISLDGRTVYVACGNAGIHKVDTVTRAFVSTIPGTAEGIALGRDGKLLYCSDGRVLRTVDDTVVGNFSPTGHGIRTSPDGRTFAVADRVAGKVHLFEQVRTAAPSSRTGRITFESVPPGAKVFGVELPLDRKYVGRTGEGFVALDLEPGTWNFKYVLAGYRDAMVTVVVGPELGPQVIRKILEADRPTTPPASASGRVGETWTNSIGMQFSWCPPGEFDMGSPASDSERYPDEGPVHRVRIPRGFWLGTYEVTQGQWQAVMGSNPAKFTGDDRRPVEQVSWNDCQEFLRKLTARDGNGYRLPSGAEWEYACRAGTTGSRYGDVDAVAWYDKNSGSTTHAVGGKRPNSWGLYDTLGNVWEWCQDTWHFGYSGAPTDGRAWDGGSGNRVLRGGSWHADARNARAAYRNFLDPDARNFYSGLRVIVLPRTP